MHVHYDLIDLKFGLQMKFNNLIFNESVKVHESSQNSVIIDRSIILAHIQ